MIGAEIRYAIIATLASFNLYFLVISTLIELNSAKTIISKHLLGKVVMIRNSGNGGSHKASSSIES
ncbi:hypothetical protein BLOT_000209 [Blomia tropicalis]|nr:hypothetical protein BLOT_000209 [Blomia tropicalis]